jgi:hypothetical protein
MNLFCPVQSNVMPTCIIMRSLVKAGLSVIVLEKGGYHRAQDPFQQWGEAEAMAHTLERGGVMASKDGNIMVSIELHVTLKDSHELVYCFC